MPLHTTSTPTPDGDCASRSSAMADAVDVSLAVTR
jgi:hypothetical protein